MAGNPLARHDSHRHQDARTEAELAAASSISQLHGTDRIKRLARRPDISCAIRQICADMAEADRAYAEREESSGYKRERFIERVPSTRMTWHHSARMLSSSQPTTDLFPGYMVHD
jgi:hypothetical protein